MSKDFIQGVQAAQQALAKARGQTPRAETRMATERMGPLMCFTPAQWALWRAASRAPGLRHPVHPCTDCTAEYQAEMLMAKRCMYPEVTFFKDSDGFISGHFPVAEAATDTTPSSPAKGKP